DMQNDSEFIVRRKRLVEQLAENQLDALLVSALPNVRYLSGFTGSNALLLLYPRDHLLVTDPRYTIQYRPPPHCRVHDERGSLVKAIAPMIAKLKPKTLGIEAARMNVATFEALRTELPDIELRPTNGMVEQLRTVKSSDEIERIRQAVLLCSNAFDNLVP